VHARLGQIILLLTIGLAAGGCEAVFVPKASGPGWTLNWASPVAYVVLLVIVALTVWGIAKRRRG